MIIPHFVQNELDASDTDLDELLSAFNWCNPFDHILPFADGTVGATDRAHLWGLYSGIVVIGIAPSSRTIGVGDPGRTTGIGGVRIIGVGARNKDYDA